MKPTQVHVGMYNFGSPRVGNGNFSFLFDNMVPNAFRIVVDGDIVTGIPPKTSRYKHVGTTVVVDGEGTGSIIIDPSFVERRLQFSSKNSVRAHYLTYYRGGLSGAIRASEEIREINRCKRARLVTAKRNIFLFPTSASRKTEQSDATIDEIDSKGPQRPHFLERGDEGDFEKQMDDIMSTRIPTKNADNSIMQSVRSIIWQKEEIPPVENSAHVSFDDPSAGSKLKMQVIGRDDAC